MHFILKLLIILNLTYLLSFTLVYATEKNHFTIAIDPEYIPFTQKDIDGEPSGLLVDFWNLWAKKNGYIVEYKFFPWEETLLATQKGEVDFHSGTTKDRDWMQASDVIYELRTGLFVKSNSSISMKRDLYKKRVGSIDKYYGSLLSDIADIVLFDEYAPMVEALKAGKIDALIDDVEAIRYFFIKTGQMNHFKMLQDKQLQFDNKVYAITNKKNAPLLKQINDGLKNLDILNLVKLEKIWLPKIDGAFYNRKLLEQVEYTSKEQKWMTNKNKLTMTGDPIWVEKSSSNGTYKGVAGDYMKSIANKMNIKLQPYLVDSWAELLATPMENSADIVLGTMNDRLRKLLEKKYTFLAPYESGPLVIITKKDIRFITDLYDIKNKNIGMLSLQNYTDSVAFKYEEYHFKYFANAYRLLDNILDNKIGAAILPLPDALYMLTEQRYKKLDIAGKVSEHSYVNIGILKNNPMLKSIATKTLLATERHYQKDILLKWTQKLNYVERINYTLLYQVIGFFLLLLFLLGVYVYTLNRKRAYERNTKLMMERMTRIDDLTGLKNKRAFNQQFGNENEELKFLGLLFIDVDSFKKYNDFYGHMQGDVILRKIANILEEFDTDMISSYRIGGEEFAYIIYGYNKTQAVELAKKICKRIEKEKIEHGINYLTISIGVSVGSFDVHRDSLYMSADKALYTAKRLGKNQVFYESV